jgi:surface antigen
MRNDVTTETLVAYVDGELDGAAAHRVETVLAMSPEARQVVRDLREGTALLRAAYNEALRAPVPVALLQGIDAAFAQRAEVPALTPSSPPQRRPVRHAFGFAIAASLALLVFTGVGSYVTSRVMVDREIARLERARITDRRLLEQVVNRALEKQLSGVTVDWRNPESGTHGTVTPVRTFKSAGGQWCREYARITVTDQRRELRRAIACREPDGNWRTRLEALSEG